MRVSFIETPVHLKRINENITGVYLKLFENSLIKFLKYLQVIEELRIQRVSR